ncbi:hypothetical protein LCGC14_0477200 [marine sediment metagenome]|uniref:Major capsid protein n=1 Tax=marine sediment metagenome TaxID=412755 RepID=A0A0F9VJA2_9ZZZZ
MAVTLVDHANQSANQGKEVQAEIAYWFLEESNLAQILPLASNLQLALQITNMETLPTVGTRKVNASFGESTGTFAQKIEGKYIFGHEIDVDTVLVKADPTERQTQRQMSAHAMAFKFNDMYINGDPASDEFKGLSMRVDDVNSDGFTDQYIDAGSATPNRGMLYDTTDRQFFMDNISKLIDVTVGHRSSALFMNSKMYLAFEACFRRENVLRQDKDMFGRIINIYQDTPLLRIGVKVDQTTEVITNSEDLSGGSDETSIYSARFGEKMYLWGIQQEPMTVNDLGEVSDAPVFRDRVQWVVGLAVANPRAIARAYGFVATNQAS